LAKFSLAQGGFFSHRGSTSLRFLVDLACRCSVGLTVPEPDNVVTHMKTTVDIADDLLLRAKKEAEASSTTLRSLIEEGLREVLSRKSSAKQKLVKPVTFRGKGLQPEFHDKGWDAIRDSIYGSPES